MSFCLKRKKFTVCVTSRWKTMIQAPNSATTTFFNHKDNLSLTRTEWFRLPDLNHRSEMWVISDNNLCEHFIHLIQWVTGHVNSISIFLFLFRLLPSSQELKLIETLHHHSRLGRQRSLISVVVFFFPSPWVSNILFCEAFSIFAWAIKTKNVKRMREKLKYYSFN